VAAQTRPGEDFHGEKRTNQSPESTSDPDARLCTMSKGKEAWPGYPGHIVTEDQELGAHQSHAGRNCRQSRQSPRGDAVSHSSTFFLTIHDFVPTRSQSC
jgi:hypothetical protein